MNSITFYASLVSLGVAFLVAFLVPTIFNVDIGSYGLGFMVAFVLFYEQFQNIWLSPIKKYIEKISSNGQKEKRE